MREGRIELGGEKVGMTQNERKWECTTMRAGGN